jgi:hypothetical protein
MWVRAFDGTSWSPWDAFTLTTSRKAARGARPGFRIAKRARSL